MYGNMIVVIQMFSFSPIRFIQMYVVYFNRLIRQDGTANGITGPIDFDSALKTRKNFHMELIELDRPTDKPPKKSVRVFKKTGEWDANRALVVTRTAKELQSEISAAIQGKVFRVATRLGRPYLREKSGDISALTGNDKYEGFIKELMDEIAKINNFTYKLQPEPNKNLGKYHRHSGQWDGILGD